MTEIKVNIDKVAAVKDFNIAACKQGFDIDIISGKYVISAKSLMGIFSLDLSRPVEVRISAGREEAEEFLESIKAFIVD